MEKYKSMNEHSDSVFVLCPRCQHKSLYNSKYCNNCGFDLNSIDNNEDKGILNFGMEVPSNGENIKEKDSNFYSQKTTKEMKCFNKIGNIMFFIIGIIAILMMILPLFSNGNFWTYYERISLGEKKYGFIINDNLKISYMSNAITLLTNIISYFSFFDKTIGYSDIMFLYEATVLFLVFSILVLGIILIIIGIKSLFFKYNSRHYRIIIGSILSLSTILIFAFNCFGIGPILLAIISASTLIYYYISGIFTKEKKFILKHLIHKSISFILLFSLLILTSFNLINVNVSIGASLFNSTLDYSDPIYIKSCRGLFVEFMQFVQCTGGDEIFSEITFKLNIVCFVLYLAYIIVLSLSVVGLLMSLFKQNMRFPIAKIIISSCLFYAFIFSLVIFNELVNEAAFQQFMSNDSTYIQRLLTEQEISKLKEKYSVFILKPGTIYCIVANLPILVYIVIARNVCLKKTYY